MQPCCEEGKEGDSARQGEDGDLICLGPHHLPGSAHSGYVCVEGIFSDRDCRRSLRTFLCVLRKEGSSTREGS